MSAKQSKYPFAKKWAAELESDGHVQISTFFLENYHRLKPYPLTHGEAMFVVHLMQHKWTEEAPYPGYKTIAKRMGVSDKTARRLAKSLDDKKYLVREPFTNWTTPSGIAAVVKQRAKLKKLLTDEFAKLCKHFKSPLAKL